jgi:uncharacterized protein YacL
MCILCSIILFPLTLLIMYAHCAPHISAPSELSRSEKSISTSTTLLTLFGFLIMLLISNLKNYRLHFLSKVSNVNFFTQRTIFASVLLVMSNFWHSIFCTLSNGTAAPVGSKSVLDIRLTHLQTSDCTEALFQADG